MPILKEEPSLYPETLLDAPPSDAAPRRWLALYTKSRQEKSLARELLKSGIPFYLPLVWKTPAVANPSPVTPIAAEPPGVNDLKATRPSTASEATPPDQARAEPAIQSQPAATTR